MKTLIKLLIFSIVLFLLIGFPLGFAEGAVFFGAGGSGNKLGKDLGFSLNYGIQERIAEIGEENYTEARFYYSTVNWGHKLDKIGIMGIQYIELEAFDMPGYNLTLHGNLDLGAESKILSLAGGLGLMKWYSNDKFGLELSFDWFKAAEAEPGDYFQLSLNLLINFVSKE
jgi:hypothetical protein